MGSVQSPKKNNGLSENSPSEKPLPPPFTIEIDDGLCSSLDRPGQAGRRDRNRRISRLKRSIRTLTPTEISDLVSEASLKGYRTTWSLETMYKYVPNTFEDTLVTPGYASDALHSAIIRSVSTICPSVSTYSCGGTNAGRSIWQFEWKGGPPILPPEFLENPLLRFIPSRLTNIKYENVQSGSKIQTVPDHVARVDDIGTGTVGIFGLLENLGPNRHVILTAGHIIDDAATIHLHDDTNADNYPLQTVPEFNRTPFQRPAYRSRMSTNHSLITKDEICLLETTSLPTPIILCVIENVNCSRFFPMQRNNDLPKLMARDPTYTNMRELTQYIDKNPLRVYKDNISSGLTSGTLVEIINDEYPFDETLFYLKIEWTAPDQPFAESGDSGSLVFARVETEIVPLGIHIGSEDTTSYALSLFSVCSDIADELDGDLFFCSPEECGTNAICSLE